MRKAAKNSILIVDDEPVNLMALTRILNKEYTVYAAESGQKAINTAKEYPPDVILLDILMPEMDGYKTIAALKNSEETRDIPVIFITGLNDIDSEKKGLALGAADYIIKPFDPDIVRLRVESQLKIVNHTRTLDEQLKQQELITKIAHSFLTDAYAESLYADTLRMIGEFMGISQILLYKLEDGGSSLVCHSEWIKPGLNLETNIGEELQLESKMISFIQSLLADRESDLYLHYNDSDFKKQMSPNRKHFNNYITVPIYIKGKIRAVLDFSREEEKLEWSKSEINLAVLVSSVFLGVFERDSMERQFSIVEHSPNLDLYITPEACVEYANPAVTAVTGYTKSELIAKGLGIIFGEKTLSDIKNKHIPDVMRGETVLFETDITRKDGEKRILGISIVQTGNSNFGIITSDLTEIKKLEAGLIAAKEEAEYSSRAKSEFLSHMSHEMRTPMNAIMGMVQIAKMHGIPNTMNKYFDEIETASHQLMDLINDVLDISSMEYGVFKLSDSVFYFRTMVKDLSQEMSYNASVKRQTLTFKVDPAIPVLLIGDEKYLKQVINTLLANAVKFTPENGKICFEARLLDENYDIITLQIEVTDNGIGISKKQQNKLFNIFEQVDGGSTRKYGGIGVGLALSKRIVEMMGGAIWLESELGKGSKFSFTCNLRKG